MDIPLAISLQFIKLLHQLTLPQLLISQYKAINNKLLILPSIVIPGIFLKELEQIFIFLSDLSQHIYVFLFHYFLENPFAIMPSDTRFLKFQIDKSYKMELLLQIFD